MRPMPPATNSRFWPKYWFMGKPFPYGPRTPNLSPGLELVQGGGDAPHPADREKQLVLGGARRERRRELAGAEDRHLGELARQELPEGRLLARVLEVPVEGPDVRDLLDHPVQDRDLGR